MGSKFRTIIAAGKVWYEPTQVDAEIARLTAERDALRAENERLRGALRQVVDHGLFHDREYLSSDLNGRLDAARAALAKGGE